MSQVIELTLPDGDAKSVMVGAEWDVAPALNWRKQKKGLKRSELAFEFTVKQESGKAVCFATFDGDRQKLKDSDALLGAVVALAFPEGRHTVIEHFSDGQGGEQYWFVAIDEGVVVFGSDVFGDREQVVGEAMDHLELSGSGSEEQIIGNAAELVSDQAENQSITEWLDGPDLWKSAALQGSGKGLLEGQSPLTIAASGGLVVVLLTSLGIMFWPESEPQNNDRMSAEQRQAILESQAKEAMQEKVAQIDKFPSIENVASIIRQSLGRLPVEQGSWALVETGCNGGWCQTTYANEGYSTAAKLRRALDGLCTVSFDPSAREAQCSMDVAMPGEKPGQRVVDLSERDKLREHILSVGDLFEGASDFGFAGFAAIEFNQSQALEESSIPVRNNWQMELPLAGVTDLAKNPFPNNAPVAVDRIEVDWQNKSFKVSGYFLAEASQ